MTQVKRGRPSSFDERLAVKIVELTEQGKTVEQIAEIIDIPARTLFRWFSSKDDFRHIVKEARQFADEMVEASLFKRALGFEAKEIKAFQTREGVETAEETKYYPPDPTSMIFWLKNRKPKEWRDRTEVDHTLGEREKEIDKIPIEVLKKLHAAKD